MAIITAQRSLEVAPWSEAPLGAWVAAPDNSRPPKRKMAFLARLAGRVVVFFPEIGFPALGSHHSESLSTRGKAELETEGTWANAYCIGPF